MIALGQLGRVGASADVRDAAEVRPDKLASYALKAVGLALLRADDESMLSFGLYSFEVLFRQVETDASSMTETALGRSCKRLEKRCRKWLKSDELALRRLAAQTIGVAANDRMCDDLLKLVLDETPEPSLGQEAIIALGNMRTPRSAAALVRAYDSGLLDKDWARLHLLVALSMHIGWLAGADMQLPANLLTEMEESVHATFVCLMECGRLRIGKLLPYVQDQLGSDNPLVRGPALYAASMLEGQKWRDRVKEEVREVSEADPEAQLPFAGAAVLLGDLDQVPTVTRALNLAVAKRDGWNADWWTEALKRSPHWSVQALALEWEALFGNVRDRWTWMRRIDDLA